MYMYCRMYMKIEYLPPVVVQVVMDKVSWGCEERYTMYMYNRMYENRVLTVCGCAGSDGQGVMGDVRRDIQCTCTIECT